MQLLGMHLTIELKNIAYAGKEEDGLLSKNLGPPYSAYERALFPFAARPLRHCYACLKNLSYDATSSALPIAIGVRW